MKITQNIPVIKVFIAEEIPSLNKGEAAILKGMLISFKNIKNKNIKVSMLSFNPKIDSIRYQDVKVIPFPIKNLIKESKLFISLKGLLFIFEYTFFCLYYYFSRGKKFFLYKNLIWDEYINSDIIIFGHDGLLENFGNKKFSFNKFVTFISTYYSIILAKKFLNKKIVIYAGSIGTYSSKLVEFFCSAALKKIDLVTLRDHFSFQYLQKLGITKNIYLTADLAFLMNRISLEKIKKIFIKESIPSDNKMLIGVTVSKELYLFTNTHLNNKEKQFTEYITLKAKVIDYLIKKYDATIMFIPHALKKTKDDRIIARDIYKKIKHKNKVILIENEYSPEELKGIISQCDIFIGERTHSNIAAVSSYVPTICISEPESHRNRGIFGNIIDKQLICDVSKTTFDVYINKIDYLVKNKNEIKKKLFENIEKNKKKSLYNSVLFSLIIDEL